ncbi:hypothetical protein [uncultured Bacteroides sp.]|uniref:hypothetical protein n=1 Tax=uncultured Bacteroides sp. TaxID=162156 RepID=UPI0025FDFB7A|nr:hypothetical protein [uncultured Bacteroides sp.]
MAIQQLKFRESNKIVQTWNNQKDWQMFLANLSYNFSFGRTFKGIQRKVDNSENDSGVMSTGK